MTRILTEADFTEEYGYLVPRDKSWLIIAHENIDDENDRNGAHAFVQMVLSVAPDFPEITTVTLDTTLEFAHRLPVSRYRSWAYAEALICLSAEEWRVVLCDDEDANSIRTWLRGILLGCGMRPTVSREDLNIRVAYELAQPEACSFTDARWDVPHYRKQVCDAAKDKLDGMVEYWVSRSP